jgi:isopenicillin-N epimerase
MDFLSRQAEGRWLAARERLATWLATEPENIALCENATAGMNEVAGWFPLGINDEVLLNNHEYGAVKRIWQRRCLHAEALLRVVTIPIPCSSRSQIVEAILSACTERTKLVVLSHITSPTAIRLPVEVIASELKKRRIACCIDGPHALLQERVKLPEIDCDFYTASCHKWLCAPLGSGFVYVAPRWHSQVRPLRLSWGRLNPNKPQSWSEELIWTGSRDMSAQLAIPAALDFFAQLDLEQIDLRNHALACYARERLISLPGAEPITPQGREWFGWMVAVSLPPGSYSTLQQRLWERHQIEVPIVEFEGRTLVRVSCHLYNCLQDIDKLHKALLCELPSSA